MSARAIYRRRGRRQAIRRLDWIGFGIVAAAVAAFVLYRAVYLEPRAWGAVCAAASAPVACLPRAGLIWLQRFYLWGAGSLAAGIWCFFWRGGFAAQMVAIVLGIGAVENYNATWGAVGAALGLWCWLRRDGWGGAAAAR